MTRTSKALTGVVIAASLMAGGCTDAGRDTAGGRTPAQLAEDRADAERQCPRTPEYRFTTDGCSMFADGAWQQCCVARAVAVGLRMAVSAPVRRAMRRRRPWSW